MPKQIANRDAMQYVRNRDLFDGSNLFSRVRTKMTAEDSESWYTVYSYGHHFPMWVYTMGKWFGNKDKYQIGGKTSRSTERHKRLTTPNYDSSEIVWVDTAHMTYLSENGYTALVANRLKGEVPV